MYGVCAVINWKIFAVLLGLTIDKLVRIIFVFVNIIRIRMERGDRRREHVKLMVMFLNARLASSFP